MSDYPEVYNFGAPGNEILEGQLVSINAVQAKKFGSDEMVQKFVANIRDKEGVIWAVWLDGAVLNRAFRDEARNRKAIGQRFAENEGVTIEFLGMEQGAQFRYKNFKVTFENAAPSMDGFDALAGSVASEEEIADLATPQEAAAPSTSGPETSPTTDDIPF